MAIKNQWKRREIRSSSLNVRVRKEEREAFQEFAASLGQTPSRVLRRLVREAITGGGDYFTDEMVGLRAVSREVAAVGNNLNQLARAANRGEWPAGGDVKRVVNAARVQTAALSARYNQSLKSVRRRTIEALQGIETDE